MINIYFMACEYIEENWKDIVDCFEESTLKIEGIPQDIINVLDGLMGKSAVQWVDRPLKMLDNETARNLVKTEEGYKALKVLLTRMPL